jgi:ectoine hydroxylase-related dioxygenase (phytanoyl-CoA dioxygenase family)
MNQITIEQKNNFLMNGYIIFPQLFSIDEVTIIANKAIDLKTIAESLAENIFDQDIHKIIYNGTQFVIQKNDDLVKIHRIVWVGSIAPDLLDISRQNKLLTPISEILRAEQANHIINQIHFKMPNDGVDFSIHQDIHNRRDFDHSWSNTNGDTSYIVCITAVDQMTYYNGPIILIPSSHVEEVARDQLKNKFDLNDGIPLLLSSGDTACMHQYLVHWSLPNESTNSRIVLINGFSYLGANHEVYPGDGSGELVNLIAPLDQANYSSIYVEV